MFVRLDANGSAKRWLNKHIDGMSMLSIADHFIHSLLLLLLRIYPLRLHIFSSSYSSSSLSSSSPSFPSSSSFSSFQFFHAVMRCCV